MTDSINEKRLGEWLVAAGKITSEQLLAALDQQRLQGGTGTKHLGEILVEREQLTARELAETLRVTPAHGRRNRDVPASLPSGEAFPAPVEAARQNPQCCIGRYVLLDELGRGGMGVVFRCFDTRLRRYVALKCILDASGASNEEMARFQREALIAARIRHRSIVAIHEVGEHEGRPFLVMDFVAGRTLAQVLKLEHISQQRVARLMYEVALALDKVHSAGILHRDLKPQNIMIDTDGQPIVMDFGLARDQTVSQRLTETGEVMGTPAYMAPEQAKATAGDQGPWTDVYGLGAVMYHALCGRPPVQGSSQMDLINYVLTKVPVAPSDLVPDVDPVLEAIILRCLEKDPSRRYPTAATLATDLLHFLEVLNSRESQVARRGRGFTGVQILGVAVVSAMVTTGAMAMVMWRENHWEQKLQQAVSAARRDGRRQARYMLEASFRRERIKIRSELEAELQESGAAAPAEMEVSALELSPEPAGAEGAQPGIQEADEAKELFEAAVAKAQRRDFNGATNDYIRIVEISPGSASAWLNLASLRIAQGQFEAGISDLDQAIRLDPNLDQAWYKRARARCFMNDVGSAINDFNRAIKLKPTVVGYWSDRARARHSLGDYDGAIADYTRAIELKPDEGAYLFNRAQAWSAKGELVNAADDLTRAIALNPNHAHAWRSRGAIRRARGDLAGAIADLTRAIAINPNHAHAWRSRGAIRRTQGDLAGAIADLTRAIDIDPSLAAAWAIRGNTHQGQGNLAAAVSDWQRFVDLAPNHQQAPAYQAAIDQARQRQAAPAAGGED